MKRYVIVASIVDPDNRPTPEVIQKLIMLAASTGSFMITEATACRDDEVALLTNRTPIDEWPKHQVEDPEWKLKKEQ